MTDKEFKKLHDKIRKIAEDWMQVLGLMWWNVTLEYVRDPRGMPSRQGNDNYCLGEAHAYWQYLEATVKFNMPDLMDKPDEELEKIVLHELVHILVWETREWAPETVTAERNEMGMKAEDRVVSTLTNAFLWTRAYARKEGARGSQTEAKGKKTDVKKSGRS